MNFQNIEQSLRFIESNTIFKGKVNDFYKKSEIMQEYFNE